MLARSVFFVLLGLSVALLSCSKDRPAPVAPAGKSLASLAAPAAPTNLRFDAPTDSSCTVRWDASDGATDYDVNYKPAVGGRWTNEPHRGTGLSNTIYGLQPNTEYRWAVRAENSDGASAWIHGSNFTTRSSEDDSLNNAPPAPTNLRIDQLTATSVRVRWDASDGATDYDVNYKAVGGRWTNEPHRGTQIYNEIEDLEPNTEYQWAVRAENTEGTSNWVFGETFTTLVSGQASTATEPPENSTETFVGTVVTDSLALVIFYRAANGDEWDDNSGWLSAQPFREWHGVGVDATGRVKSLSLDRNGLTGRISTALGQLSQLERLSLDRNGLTGSIPATLGQLAQLEELSLAPNELTGSIPPELGNLSKLCDLSLDRNDLTGSIPATLGQLAQLEKLYLHDNGLTGSIPAELGNLSKLHELWLRDNELTGSIPPELGQLAQLERLDLTDNELTGSIPAELGNLSKLYGLYLSNNGLTGSIPAELGNLSRLRDLFLNHNELTGSIPATLGQLSQLDRLYLYANSLTGCSPSSLFLLPEFSSDLPKCE